MSYRPITDVWWLARCKYKNGVKYYGGFPGGFLKRARNLLGVSLSQPVLHVCAGMVRHYPYSGFGPNDRTLDLDPSTSPDFLRDARLPFPTNDPYWADEFGVPGPFLWPAILIDRPYTPEDAEHYAPGKAALPTACELLKNGLKAVVPGGKVGMLDYLVPSPPRGVKCEFVASVAVMVGYNNRIRVYSVFERP